MDNFKSKVKSFLLGGAELIDAYRIFPRAILAIYGLYVYQVSTWFMLLIEPTTQQTGMFGSVIGMCAVVIGLYTNSGRKWG